MGFIMDGLEAEDYDRAYTDTTLLITHRLSQIRWADWVLVMRQGEIVDQGTHDDLLGRCDLYRRIFSHYDVAEVGNRQPASGHREGALVTTD